METQKSVQEPVQKTKVEPAKNREWHWFIVCTAILTLAAHYCFYIYQKTDQLEMQLRLASQKERIDNDQIRDLIYDKIDLVREKDSMKAQGYVAGLLDGIKRENYWNEVWHDGYNRGSEIRQQIAESFLKRDDKVIETGSKK